MDLDFRQSFQQKTTYSEAVSLPSAHYDELKHCYFSNWAPLLTLIYTFSFPPNRLCQTHVLMSKVVLKGGYLACHLVHPEVKIIAKVRKEESKDI